MSSKTIAKISAFVIYFAALSSIFSACDLPASTARQNASAAFGPPQTIGHITDPDITEASGLIVSKCQPNVLWTHNDSGDGPFIYAISPTGENLGTWRVAKANNIDWEDIAERKEPDGTCRIYIGEIGDNDAERDVHSIYRVREPQITEESRNSRQKNAAETEYAEVVNFSYADNKQNAETLLVHPASGDIYVLTKRREGPSRIYKIAPKFGETVVQRVQKVAEVSVPSVPIGLLTGGDISSDGRRIILCDYKDGYELTLPGGDNNFDDIWKQQPVEIDLGKRDQGEAVTYAPDGNTIYATSEGSKPPIIEVLRK